MRLELDRVPVEAPGLDERSLIPQILQHPGAELDACLDLVHEERSSTLELQDVQGAASGVSKASEGLWLGLVMVVTAEAAQHQVQGALAVLAVPQMEEALLEVLTTSLHSSRNMVSA